MRNLVLFMLLAGQTAAGQNAFIEVQRSQTWEVREREALFFSGRILDRLANPLNLNPEEEFRQLQERYLDLRDPKQRAFLEQVRQTDDPLIVFVMDFFAPSREAKQTVTVEGWRIDPATGKKELLFEDSRKPGSGYLMPEKRHVVPTRANYRKMVQLNPDRLGRVPSAIRRDPLSGVPIGLIYGSAYPPTKFGLVRRSGDRYRTDVAVDFVYGKLGDGSPLLSFIEYTTNSLITELYLHIPWTGDTVVRTADFGSLVKLEAARPNQQFRRLQMPLRVSILAPLRDVDGTVAYNPRDLRPEEASALARAIRRVVPVDAIVVDPTATLKGGDIGIIQAGSTWALLGQEFWERIVRNGLGTLPKQPSFGDITLTDEARAILEEASTIELPVGTEVAADSQSGIGVRLHRPDQPPMAQFLASDVSWISFDEKYVNRAMSEMAVPVGSEPVRLIKKDGSDVLLNRTLVKEPGLPAPIVILDTQGAGIEVRVSMNWTNPLTETDRRDAYGFRYDPKTSSYEYVTDGLLPTTPKNSARPRLTSKPTIDEIRSR